MICPDCGIDHHASDGGADEVAIAEARADELEASLEHHELQAQTEVELAEVHEGAETERAEIAAEAAVDIAEAQAGAEVASAEVIAEALTAESTPEDEPVDEVDDEDLGDEAELEGEPAAEATPVSVPPQIKDDTPRSAEAKPGARTTNAFQARRMSNRRR